MKFISHRGNISGRNEVFENEPYYIKHALNSGYDVEIDGWYLNDKFYLGHDKPTYEVNIDFFSDYRLWCHAKNIGMLYKLLSFNKIYMNCFFHDNDAATLTSQGFIWTHCDQDILTPLSICVLPEKNNTKKVFIDQGKEICAGICSDVIEDYKKCFV